LGINEQKDLIDRSAELAVELAVSFVAFGLFVAAIGYLIALGADRFATSAALLIAVGLLLLALRCAT